MKLDAYGGHSVHVTDSVHVLPLQDHLSPETLIQQEVFQVERAPCSKDLTATMPTPTAMQPALPSACNACSVAGFLLLEASEKQPQPNRHVVVAFQFM